MITFVIEMEGGLIQSVHATEDIQDVRILVLDRDTEGAEESHLVTVHLS